MLISWSLVCFSISGSFQVSQLTALVVRVASIRGAPFNINLDRVAVSREAVEVVINCVQEFERDPLFTQKSLFSDSGVAMLKDALAVANSVIVGEEFSPWSVFGDGCNQDLVIDMQSCHEKVVLRRKAYGDTSELCFGTPRACLPSAIASAGRSCVQISIVVEEAQVEYVAVLEPTACSSRTVKSPVIESKRETSALSGQMSRKSFGVVRPVTSPPDELIFGTALDREASGSHRVIVGLLQFSSSQRWNKLDLIHFASFDCFYWTAPLFLCNWIFILCSIYLGITNEEKEKKENLWNSINPGCIWSWIEY